MISLSCAASGGLIWSKTPIPYSYELKLNGEVIGSLRRTSFWSSEFLAESSNGCWRFRRTRCFQAEAEILDGSFGAQIAIMKVDWRGGGRLSFADGQTYQIASRGFWRPVWMVLAENEQPVLLVRSRLKTVEMAKNLSLPQDRLMLLTMFTWYLLQQASEEAASVAAVVAATA
jgi:hypothetical protein